MKIPEYTAQATVTREAPGRQIRARQSPSAMAQAELDKQKPMSAALKAAGEYAKTRYNIQTENNLNDALLDAQEALRERRKELEKDPDYNNILDGDNPIWNKETDQLKRDLLKKVGKDRYALQQFNSRFGNLELQNRFALRDAVDRRVQIAAEQNRARKLNDAEDQIANSLDLSQISFVLKDIVQDTKKLAQIRAGNLDVLTEQQREMIKRAAYRALEKNADNAPSGIAFIDEIRVALRDGVSADSLDPRGEGKSSLSSNEAAYVYGLMQMLEPDDQVKILRSVGGTQEFIEGPSLAEQNAQKVAKNYSSELSNQMNVRLDQVSKGNIQSNEAMNDLANQITSTSQLLSNDESVKLQKKYDDLLFLNDLTKELGIKANLGQNSSTNISAIKNQFSKGMKGQGLEGIDTDLEEKAFALVETFEKNLQQAMSVEGDPIGFAQSVNMDGVNIKPVDLSVQAMQQGTSGIQERINSGRIIQSLNDLDFVPVLSKSEANQIVANITDQELTGVDASFTYLKSIIEEVGPENSGLILENLRREGLDKAYIQAAYMDNAIVANDLLSIKNLSVEELKKGQPTSVTGGSTGIPQTLADNKKVRDYNSALLAGGDGAATKRLFNEQYEMVEKLSLYYTSRGMNVTDAVEKSVESIFVGEVNITKNQQYIVPNGIDNKKIEDAAQEILSSDILKRFNLAPLAAPNLDFLEESQVSEASLRTTGMWLNNGTGDGLILHYNLNGTFIPALIIGDDPAIPGGVFEVKFKDLENMDFTKLRESDLPLKTKELAQFATGFKIQSGPVYTGTGYGSMGTAPVGSELPGYDSSVVKNVPKSTVDKGADEYSKLVRKALTSIPSSANETNRSNYQKYVKKELDDFRTDEKTIKKINLLSFPNWLKTQGD
jgi:hypothetical protein